MKTANFSFAYLEYILAYFPNVVDSISEYHYDRSYVRKGILISRIGIDKLGNLCDNNKANFSNADIVTPHHFCEKTERNNMCAKTYIEPQTTLVVYDECDLLVVGGGSAGHSAAVAAARAGCKNIILMERYGYCGGDVTGSYVLMLPCLSFYQKNYVRGLMHEWIQRLEKVPGGVVASSLEDMGKEDDAALIQHWKRFPGTVYGYTQPRINRAAQVDPQQLKIEMDKMLLEYSDSIRILYHSWGTKPIMEGNTCKGVIFESKEGRKAILAKQVIDATGDLDLCRQTGGETSSLASCNARSSHTALTYRIGGFSFQKYCEWNEAHPDAAAALKQNYNRITGIRALFFPTPDDNISWANNWHGNRDCSTVAGCTQTEIEGRLHLREGIEYLKQACPYVFHDAYLVDVAPQMGARGSHRLVGDYTMTYDDFLFKKQHDDVIAWHSTMCALNDHAPVEIPLRALLQKGINNISAPGRHMAADKMAIDSLNLIPQCVGTGQAAGVAAAVAIADRTTLRDVDIRKVQDILAGEQDVPLPRNDHTDISYTQCAQEHEYGLYTSAAQKAIAAAGQVEHFEWGALEH